MTVVLGFCGGEHFKLLAVASTPIRGRARALGVTYFFTFGARPFDLFVEQLLFGEAADAHASGREVRRAFWYCEKRFIWVTLLKSSVDRNGMRPLRSFWVGGRREERDEVALLHPGALDIRANIAASRMGESLDGPLCRIALTEEARDSLHLPGTEEARCLDP